jgi:hypothetical protein
MVDPALDTLRRLIGERKQKGVALAAARDVLDRAGLGAPERFELTGGVNADLSAWTVAQLAEGVRRLIHEGPRPRRRRT